ncbi:MAG TPA: PPC domain-containing protein [Bryobacteraceae bacterium]|nr:PPC domain-containing protein [Bryobacteraceae bacterium]
MRPALFLIASVWLQAASEPPTLAWLHPLGGKAGTLVEVEFVGTHLEGTTGVEFDCADLVWKHTTHREPTRLTGIVSIAPSAAFGGHMLRVVTGNGPTTSLLFTVGQFPAMTEGSDRAVPSLPAEVYGRLDGAADSDVYWFPAKAGERWVFDLHAMEHGSAVEARMILQNGRGERIAFNDDRDHYDENPLIEHTFAEDGVYAIKLDQYRGPRGFTFGKNNSYVLRISALPWVRSVSPLGARRGSQVRFLVEGSALQRVQQVYLTGLRRGEYARMTYPYTMPIKFRPDPPHAAGIARIDGKATFQPDGHLEAAFAIPADAETGLWKLWLAGPDGVAEGPNLQVGDIPEFSEETAAKAPPAAAPYVINGQLSRPRERDVFRIEGKAGEPLHVSTLSAQLGGPYLDTVLTLRDAAGKKLAENDDVVAGWGGLLGNPDSSLFYTPKQAGPLWVEVRDRLSRGGSVFPYRMKVDHATPGFQLFTTPENFTVRRGESAILKVHLVREAGFAGEVEVWFEEFPSGVPPLRAKFRADQLFEPNADGADMIIPEIGFRVQGPAASGTYRIRIFGRAADGTKAEAHTATMIGPIYQGDWNYFRRPVPDISLTVVE